MHAGCPFGTHGKTSFWQEAFSCFKSLRAMLGTPDKSGLILTPRQVCGQAVVASRQSMLYL